MENSQTILDAAEQLEIITRLMEKVMECYVFPDIAGQICAGLKQHFEDGDYADNTEGELFALALTLHLQEANRDEHLWVRWHSQPLPEEDTLRLDPGWQEQRRLEARLDNFGLQRVERLAGNIGCLDIRYFHRPEWGGETVAAALSFVAHTGALIIDLRRCTGGYPGMLALVSSYLFGEQPVHLSSIYWRDEDLTQEYWTSPEAASCRYSDRPVYVLTSRATFSAGEVFAAILQARGRATVIGDQTDGGSHPGAAYRIHPHFEAFIPIGRAFDPLTGQELEGVGVTPDIRLPHEQAFTAAYGLALRKALEDLNGAESEPLQALEKEARAALKELAGGRKLCPACGYPNAEYHTRCKNCGQLLPAE